MSNYTRWYRVGNVKLVQNSRTIEGTDTYWMTAGINPGDLFTIDGAQFYEVDAITDNTHLTLKNPYTGVSVNDSTYSIIRNFTATMPADIAARTAELLGDFRRYIDTDMRSIHGESAYELAVQNGFVGTEVQWLDSLKAGGEFLQMQNALASFETSADDRMTAIEGNAGDIDNLSTSNKDNLVSAINEVFSNAGTLSQLTTSARLSLVAAVNELVNNQGPLSSLTTSAKSNVVSAINELSGNEGALNTLTTSAKNTLVASLNEVHSKVTTRTDHIIECRELGGAGYAHNLIYRGKCLGEKPTAAQLAAIADGTFDDMYLGDYWTGVGNSGYTGLKWMIVHFNYMWDNFGQWNGEAPCNHLIVMQMRSATASEVLNQKGGRVDSGNSELPSGGINYFWFGESGTDLNEQTGVGGARAKLVYNALIPTFGYDHLLAMYRLGRQVKTNGEWLFSPGTNYSRVWHPFYHQLTGQQLGQTTGKAWHIELTNNSNGYLDIVGQQFAAFRIRPFLDPGFGLGTDHMIFWLADHLGPDSSGNPLMLLGSNAQDIISCFRARPMTYSEAKSTYHVYAGIK